MGNPTTQVDLWPKYRSYFWVGFVIFCAIFIAIWHSERSAVDAYNARNIQVIAQRQAVVKDLQNKTKKLSGYSPDQIKRLLNLPDKPRWIEHYKSQPDLDKDDVEKWYFIDDKTGAQYSVRFLQGHFYDVPNSEQPPASGMPWGWWIVELQARETLWLWSILLIYFFMFSWSRRVASEMMLAVPVLYVLINNCRHEPTNVESVVSITAMLAGSFALLWVSYKSPRFNARLCRNCGCDLTGLEAHAPCPGCGLVPGGRNPRFHEALKERVARGLESDESGEDESPPDAETQEPVNSQEPPVEPGDAGESAHHDEP